MIFDSFHNLNKYKGLYERLDIVIEYLENNDISQYKDGKYEIEGDDIYFNVISTSLCLSGDYEYHEQYLDLHIDLVGEEYILFANSENNKEIKKYDRKTDYALVKGTEVSRCLINGNNFVICMLKEPHLPCIKVNKEANIRKVIFKIKIQ